MTVKEEINAALKVAMRAKDVIARNSIRELNAAIKQREIDDQKILDDDGVLRVVQQEMKKYRDSIAELERANRPKQLQEARAKLAVLAQFLPKQLSWEEIESLAIEAMTQTGISSLKDMGKLMKILMPQVVGRADGRVVSEVVRSLLKRT